MKKILLVLLLVSSPAFAACSITGGACSISAAAGSSDLYVPSLQEKHTPNYLQQMQKPNAFQSNYQNPYDNRNINTGSGGGTAGSSPTEGGTETQNYNATCQFGACFGKQAR